jgi:hypothetical protein
MLNIKLEFGPQVFDDLDVNPPDITFQREKRNFPSGDMKGPPESGSKPFWVRSIASRQVPSGFLKLTYIYSPPFTSKMIKLPSRAMQG